METTERTDVAEERSEVLEKARGERIQSSSYQVGVWLDQGMTSIVSEGKRVLEIPSTSRNSSHFSGSFSIPSPR